MDLVICCLCAGEESALCICVGDELCAEFASFLRENANDQPAMDILLSTLL